MADNTNRFGLNTYSQGDTNWDHTDTVETIDELAIERGAAADRPASGDYDDELYLATDQQILYRWDATATDWIVEGVGSESDPLPKVWANEIDVNALEAESVNTDTVSPNISIPPVTHIAYKEGGETKIRKQNGEVTHSGSFAGDVVESFISDQGSDPFHLSLNGGEYETDWDQFAIYHSHQHISGAGKGVTTVKLFDDAEEGSNVGVLKIEGEDGDFVQHSSFSDLSVDGNRSGTGIESSANETVEYDFCQFCGLIGVDTYDGPDDNIDLDNADNNWLVRCESYDPRADGIHMSIGANRNWIIDCYSEGAGTAGVTQQNGASENIYIGTVSKDSYWRNWDITDEDDALGTVDTTGRAIVSACRSIGNPSSHDNFEGARTVELNGSDGGHEVFYKEFEDDTEIFEQAQLQDGREYTLKYSFGTSDATQMYLTFDNVDSGDYDYVFEDGQEFEQQDRIALFGEAGATGITFTGEFSFHVAHSRNCMVRGSTGKAVTLTATGEDGAIDNTLTKAATRFGLDDMTLEFITEGEDGDARIRTGYLAIYEKDTPGTF